MASMRFRLLSPITIKRLRNVTLLPATSRKSDFVWCIARLSRYVLRIYIYAGVPAHAAFQAAILRVICRATIFVGLQPLYVHISGGESVSRRYVYVRAGAELLRFDEG